MAHRGKEFVNKFHFNHPQLHLMTSEKIANFLIDNSIQRVLVFADGWTTGKCNQEYGPIYVNQNGLIKQSEQNKTIKDSKISATIKSPLIYFLRDLISESIELSGNVKIYIFQNTIGYNYYLSENNGSTALDYTLIHNRLSQMIESKNADSELFNKLALSAFANSLVGVSNVHMIYTPLITSYSDPGANSPAKIPFSLIDQVINEK